MRNKIGISGVSGRIGGRLIKLVLEDPKFNLHAGTVSASSQYLNTDLGKLLGSEELGVKATNNYSHSDIWIDFSTPDAFDKVLMHCIATKTPLVTGTTGLSQN